MPSPNINSPRYQRWYVQQQTNLLSFNNSSGTWVNTGAQLIRVDTGSVSTTRNAPYSRFPVLTGTKSEVAGIRGRKGAAWSIRGLPVIPSGTGGTIPDTDILWQNIFGAANGSPAGSGATATFVATSGAVTSVTVTAGGTGYTPGATLISFPTGTGATAVVQVSSAGVVTGATVVTGGTGYTSGTATISPATGNLYTFSDTGYLPFSLLGFNHAFTTLTERALWGCYITRATFNLNQNFLTCDLDGFAGYVIDNIGFSQFDTQATAGLTAFPLEPTNPPVAGQPIQGFGLGYALISNGQNLNLKVKALRVTIETGFVPEAGVLGSAYLVAAVGDSRRISVDLGDVLDDDSTQLNNLKIQSDTDLVGTGISMQVVAGNQPGSQVQWAMTNIQPNAFNLRDTGPTVSFELPTSYAHASAVGLTNDLQMCFY